MWGYAGDIWPGAIKRLIRLRQPKSTKDSAEEPQPGNNWLPVPTFAFPYMKITVSKSFFPLFDISALYLVMVGGAGSGKSEFAGRKIFYRSMKERGAKHRFLILRKVRVTLRESCILLMLSILAENEIPYEHNKSERTITFYNPWGEKVEWLFEGLDDREKIKSIKDITSVWLEEATEFNREDFLQIDLRLRGETKYYKQIMLSFNPDQAQAPWLKEDFFDKPREGVFVHHSTIEDNPIEAVRKEYLKKLEAIGDDTYYKIYRLGQWALARGIIYNWDVKDLPTDKAWDGIVYGLDFGYSVDPAVLIKIYRKADEYWLEELIYEKGLTNQALAAKAKTCPGYDIDTAIIYADSSEPKSIEELCREGILVKPAVKGPDSVRTGIDFMKSRKVHVVTGSNNLLDETRHYKWKEDKNGNTLPEPVDFNNHGVDAARYGVVTDYYEGMGDVDFIVLG